MNAFKNALIALLLLIVAALGIFTWWQSRQIKYLTAEVARSVREHDLLIRERQDKNQAIMARRERAPEEPSRQNPSLPPPENNARPVMIAPNAVIDTPALQRALLTSMKEALDQRYARLYHKLKLSPAELDKLRDLLTEKQMSAVDVMREAQLQGLNPLKNASEIADLMKKVQGGLDENIHALIGEENYQQYQDFSRNISSYSLLDRIDRRLSFSAPLQESQADALLQILLRSTEPPPAPGGPNGPFVQTFVGPVGMSGTMGQARITDETISAAQAVLSPQQIEVLRQIQADQQSQASLMEPMQGNMIVPPPDASTSPRPR